MPKIVSKNNEFGDSINRYALLMPRSEAEEVLRGLIRGGEKLLGMIMIARAEGITQEKFNEHRNNYSMWRDRVREILTRMFSTDAVRNELGRPGLLFTVKQTLLEKVSELDGEIREDVQKIESIASRLDYIPEAQIVRPISGQLRSRQNLYATKRVFVVHGHDEASKQSVARTLERLGLDPIILHEQSNQGRTIIEKLEHHSDVGFAVVLLTPDDVGAAKNSQDNLMPRARQNVILELGLFIGKLGRNRVCALKVGDVEVPGDIDGVVYVPIDSGDGWRFSLAKELRDAGYEIDMNRL